MFFLELNGRIQVEHPVTEAVTGLDLVELQLRVADGESLAELAARCDRSCGRGTALRRGSAGVPAAARDRRRGCGCRAAIRVDAGVEEGDEVGASYDPMIAKLIAHGADREEALDRLAAALDETVVEGVTTNLPVPPLARRASRVPRRRTLSTDFLERFPPLSPLRPRRPRRARGTDGWRLNLQPPARRPPLEVEAAAEQRRRPRAATGA